MACEVKLFESLKTSIVSTFFQNKLRHIYVYHSQVIKKLINEKLSTIPKQSQIVVYQS